MEKKSATGFSSLILWLVLFVSAVSAGCASPNINAMLEEETSLPRHCIYRPKDLDGLAGKLPIVVMGEGGCLWSGGTFSQFLGEIASKQYLVIANNRIHQTAFTTPDMLLEAITWAFAENSRPESKYFGKINTAKVAVMGQSCGGLEALHAGSDPRVSTVVAWNSGIHDTIKLGGATKADLLKIHTPTMWVNGGPKDFSYPQAQKNFAQVPDHVPSVWANYDLSNQGISVIAAHMGTFLEPKGGEYARVAILWLDFILKDVWENWDQFVGENCGLCSVPHWSVQSKNWEHWRNSGGHP